MSVGIRNPSRRCLAAVLALEGCAAGLLRTRPRNALKRWRRRDQEPRTTALPQRSLERMRQEFPFLAEATEAYALGDVWSRPGLDNRTRQLAAVAAFAAIGAEDLHEDPRRLRAQRRRVGGRAEGNRLHGHGPGRLSESHRGIADSSPSCSPSGARFRSSALEGTPDEARHRRSPEPCFSPARPSSRSRKVSPR